MVHYPLPNRPELLHVLFLEAHQLITDLTSLGSAVLERHVELVDLRKRGGAHTRAGDSPELSRSIRFSPVPLSAPGLAYHLPEQTRENLRCISREQLQLAYKGDRFGLEQELDRLFRLWVLVTVTGDLVLEVHREIRGKLEPLVAITVGESTSSDDPHVTPAPPCRLIVNRKQSFVSLDGEVMPVGEVCAPFLQALVDAPGEWRTLKDIRAKYPNLKDFTRLDRDIKKLPAEIRKLIQSSPRGYRLAETAWQGPVSFLP